MSKDLEKKNNVIELVDADEFQIVDADGTDVKASPMKTIFNIGKTIIGAGIFAVPVLLINIKLH